MRDRGSRAARIGWLFVMALSSTIGGGGCYGLNLSLARAALDRQGPTPRCDVIVVPGCPASPDGSPSTCIRRRVDAALDAYHQGASAHLMFSGGSAHNAFNEAQAMAAYARTRGVPETALVLEPKARHTVENLRFSSLLMRARGWRTALVVTDALQLPFALELAARLGLTAYGRLAHAPLPAREARSSLPFDRVEPVPKRWWL